MSVSDVTKMWSKTGGSLSSEKLSTITQKWAITEGFQVVCAATDTIDIVVAAVAALYPIGTAHATVSPAAYVKSYTPSQMSPILWVVVVNYEGIVSEDGVDVEWTDVTSTEEVDRDWDGNAIVTANNEPVKGLTMDIADQVVTIRRTFMTIDTAGIAQYRRATNSDEFLGWPPGTARLVGFSAKNRFLYSGVNEMWDVTARIQFREPYANTTAEQAWYKRWRHEGFYVNIGGVIQRATDDMGQEMSRPVLLKEDGTLETDPDAAHFFHTQVYGSLPYSGLGLV